MNTEPDATPSVAPFTADLRDAFAFVEWAEDEIEQACRRHPDQADALYHAFGLLRPRDIGPGMGTEFVYRSHVGELLERVAAGTDTRPATAAEMCLVCADTSLRVPLRGAAAGFYFRMWLRAFPGHPVTPDQAAEQVHYERLYSATIDDYEATLHGRAADPDRRAADIACAGMHHGTLVTCRFATSPRENHRGPST